MTEIAKGEIKPQNEVALKKLQIFFQKNNILPITRSQATVYRYTMVSENEQRIVSIDDLREFALGHVTQIQSGRAVSLPKEFQGYISYCGKIYFISNNLLPETKTGQGKTEKDILKFYEEYFENKDQDLFISWYIDDNNRRVIGSISKQAKDIMTINKLYDLVDFDEIKNVAENGGELEIQAEKSQIGEYHIYTEITIESAFEEPIIEEVMIGKNGSKVILPKKAITDRLNFSNPRRAVKNYKYLKNYFTDEEFENIFSTEKMSNDEIAEGIFELMALKEHLAPNAKRIIRKLLGELISLI